MTTSYDADRFHAALAIREAPVSPATGGKGGARLMLVLLVLVPLTAVLELLGTRGTALFLVAVLAMVPLASFLGRATEEIAIRSSPALGGLLSATFGNAIELLISARLLMGSDPEAAAKIVRASIVGSLVTNLLLLVGLAMLAGGLKYKEQRFNQMAAGISSSLLIIAFGSLSIPTIHYWYVGPEHVVALSQAVSVIVALLYLAGILFTFRTHRHLFAIADEAREVRAPEWPLRRSLAVLAVSVLAVAYLAGVLERTLDDAGHELKLSKSFVGVVVIGAITNVAENLSAMSYARKNMIDLAIQIGTSSAIQIVLFVVPLLVLLGYVTGHPFGLQFTLFELGCMLLAVMITNHLAADGVCNWLEGLQLIALYLIIGAAFYFVP